jgi:mRNA interferase RelE/StbE
VKRVRFTASAAKGLAKMPSSVRQQIGAKLRRYAETGAGDVKSLVGRPGRRLRSGDHRIIFLETADEIEVLAVGDRRDIYE